MSTKLSNALHKAAENGYLDEVKHLLDAGADPKAGNSYALRCAVDGGQLEIVKLLLLAPDPKANGSWALRGACENGCIKIVELLLPYSNAAEILKCSDFIVSPACNLPLSCLPSSLAKQFMNDNTGLDLPRTRAMLAAQGLSHRKVPTKQVARHIDNGFLWQRPSQQL